MMKFFRGSGLLMLALLVGTTTAFAAKEAQGVLHVEDKAKLFSAEGIKKAEDKFHDITFKATTHWTVVTLSDVPASKKADLEAVGGDKNKANRFFSELAASMFKERNEVGVITLVYANGDRLMVKTRADKGSDLHRHFSDTDCATLDEKIIDHLRAAKKKTGEEASTERDGGLLAGTSFVIDQLKDTSLPEAKKTVGSTVSKANNDVKASTGMSIWSWVCIGLVAALSIWVVIALVRALTNRGGGGGMGGGGMGGGGMGGGGMGGGGMGFFGSFMTGMLGAAAGMWMYNSFMGGNQHGNDMAAGGADGGGDNGSTGTGEGNIDGGSEGGAADWNGGDNGGGGDTGGGGDWGGGGGDTGGGGDWGGGGDAGGGDFGGGGGDW